MIFEGNVTSEFCDVLKIFYLKVIGKLPSIDSGAGFIPAGSEAGGSPNGIIVDLNSLLQDERFERAETL